MKQTKFFWGFLLLIIALVTGCSKEDVVNNDTSTPPNTENRITLRASTGSDTRIGFEEATDKIKLTWKKADKFALYDATGALAATFTLTGGDGTANGTFETENTLTDGVSYTVCYPAIADATTLAAWENTMETRQRVGQTVDMSNSDPMTHLSDIFGMSQKDYTYNASSPASIKFSHHYAMLTLEIAKPAKPTDYTDVPTALRFVNGSVTTVVTLASFPTTWAENDTLKVYALILPSAGTERTLSFSLDGESTSYVADVNSSTAYEAGKRYTAKLENTNVLAAQASGFYYQINNGTKTLWNTERFISALTDDNSTVLISTVGGTKMNSTNYKDLLDAINSTLRTGITLDFSGAMAEAGAMTRYYDDNEYKGIKAVYGFPVGITSLAAAFRNFSNLTSIAEIPNSATDMYWTFYNCTSFNQPVTIPNSVTNMSYTFSRCTNFNQPVTIPNDVTNMDGTFSGCTNFDQPVTIPNDVTNMDGTFSGCTNFDQPVTIGNSVTNMNRTFYDCTNFDQPVTIGNSVTSMRETFSDCTSFNQQITIPNSVTNMQETFAYCKSFNQQITIPNSVTDMRYAFRYCSALASTITIYGASSLTRGWIFEHVNTENIDLILGPKRVSEWAEKTWEGYTFKSITSTSTSALGGSSVLDRIEVAGSAW